MLLPVSKGINTLEGGTTTTTSATLRVSLTRQMKPCLRKHSSIADTLGLFSVRMRHTPGPLGWGGGYWYPECTAAYAGTAFSGFGRT